MYERKPENDRAIDRAWKVLEELGRGDMLSHEVAEEALGVPRSDPRYYKLIDRLKRRLEGGPKGISLVAAPMVGYFLATPKEQLELTRFRMLQSARRLRKGANHVGALPVEACSFTELRVKQTIEERLAREEKGIRQAHQLMAMLMRPRDQQPRIAQDGA